MDLSSFELEVVVHRTLVLAFVRNLAKFDQHIAEDIVQETMMRAWLRWDTFRTDHENNHREDFVKSWLFTIARNEFYDWLRSKRSANLYKSEVEATDRDETTKPLSIEEQVCDEVIEALADTDEKFRECLIRHVIDEQKHKEIAADLGIAVGTVKSRIARASAFMRMRLGKTWTPVAVVVTP